MLNRFVIGYEATPQGEDALALGALVAETLATTPVVATVMPWPRRVLRGEKLDRALATETDETLRSARARLSPLEVETEAIANPSPAAALFELAERTRARLVVLGSTHGGPVGRALPGGVAEALLHGGPCAVAVAPRGFATDPPSHVLRIGIAFDGSPEAWAALETGIGLADRANARLLVLSVAEPPGFAASASVPGAAEYQGLELSEKQQLIELALKRVPPDLPVESRLLRGHAGRALSEAAADVDLLIVGSRGYGPLRRTFLGSTSSRLIRSATAPVLVLPRGVLDPLRLGDPARRQGVGEAPPNGSNGGGAVLTEAAEVALRAACRRS